jgi:hypothetical protein
MNDTTLPFTGTTVECPLSGHTHCAAYMCLGKSEVKTLEFLRCFQIPAKSPDQRCNVIGYFCTARDLKCCCCEKEILVGNPMFLHPADAPRFKGASLYCHHDCYHDTRATKKAKFPSNCASCSEKIPIGDGITKNSDGKWVHDPACTPAIRGNRKLSAADHDKLAMLSVKTDTDRCLSFLATDADGPASKVARTSYSSAEDLGGTPLAYAMASTPGSDALLRHLEIHADSQGTMTVPCGGQQESQGTVAAGQDESQGTSTAAEESEELSCEKM